MADNKYISVDYELYIFDGDQEQMLVEKTSSAKPFSFVTGLSYTLPDFEAAVCDLNKGDAFDFIVKKENAYGDYDENLVKRLPKEIFRNGNGHFDAATIFAGNVVPMVNEEGMQFDGLVKEVTQDTVVVDFNHSLAGVDLRFKGHIVDSHSASGEEITAFVNQMSGENEECSCHGNGEYHNGQKKCHGNHQCGEHSHCNHDKPHSNGTQCHCHHSE